MQPTPAQIERYRADGFLVVEEFVPRDEVERVRARFADVFAHRFETGLEPDEVNYEPGVTPPDRTRQLCNVWKADRVLAATTLARRNAEFCARLAGLAGLRLVHDNCIWKPPSGTAILCHQDAAYCGYLVPPNMTTCWIALDETRADTGTISYVRGSHRWPRSPLGGRFHAPDDWLAHVRECQPPGVELELVPIEVPPGGIAVHDGWTFHGSAPNVRADAERRAIIAHMMAADTRWNLADPHPIYSKTAGRPTATRSTRRFTRSSGARTATARRGSTPTRPLARHRRRR